MNLILGIPLIILVTLIVSNWYLDYKKDECQKDERYQAMLTASWGVIGLVGSYGLFILAIVSI